MYCCFIKDGTERAVPFEDSVPIRDGGLQLFFKSLQYFGGLAATWIGIYALKGRLDIERGPAITLLILGLIAHLMQFGGFGCRPYWRWVADYVRRNIIGRIAIFHFCTGGGTRNVGVTLYSALGGVLERHHRCEHCTNETSAVEIKVWLGGWRKGPGDIVYHRSYWSFLPGNVWTVRFVPLPRRLLGSAASDAYRVIIIDANDTPREVRVTNALDLLHALIFQHDACWTDWDNFDSAVTSAIMGLPSRLAGARACLETALTAFDSSSRMPFTEQGRAFRPLLVDLWRLIVPKPLAAHYRFDEGPAERREHERAGSRRPAAAQRIVAVRRSEMPPSDDDGTGNYR